MKKITLLLLILVFTNINAQITFGDENVIIETDVIDPTSVFAADIDGDGDMDMISASSGDYKIAWYENIDGNGTFGRQQIITTDVDSAQSVFAIDIDGDGDMDVLSASENDDKIAWYENTDGYGTFGAQQIITASADGAQSVFAADIDGDGDMDVLSASQNDDKIAWYENTDGNGTFDVQQIITTNADYAQSVFVADIDSDGDMDVLSASSYDNKIAWYENTDSNGTFGAQQIITTDAYYARSVFASDIDGDGDMDLLTASNEGVFWYENTDGNGVFGVPQLINTNHYTSLVFAADIDGDGDMDVLSATYNDYNIIWFENIDGNGTFGTQQTIITSASYFNSIFATDIDGDGDMDVLSASYKSLLWFENTNGNGTFDTEQIITINADGTRSVFSSDIDGDGDMDMLSTSSVEGVFWSENTDSHGTFGEPKIITANVDFAKSVFVTDVDDDGDMDVLSASYNDDKIAWYENTDGNGTFGTQQIITTSADGAQSVFAADIDGDGDMDVLSASSRDDKIAWYENTDGQGAFGTPQIITIDADYATSVFAADIDGDGDMDVLSASSNDNKIAWYENTDGNGTFGAQQIITINVNFPKSIFATDIDGDGDIDVLSASTYDNKIAWYENTNSTFNIGQIITTSADGAQSVFAVDIDGDGDMDVLSASTYDNKIAWYENTDGNGAFGTQQVIRTNADGEEDDVSVFATDIDGDGDMDVLYACGYKLAWHENLGLTRNEFIGAITSDVGGNCGAVAPNILIQTANTTESYATFSLTNGLYQLFPETGNYTTEIVPSSIPNYYTVNPNLYNDNFTDIGNSVTHDFCLIPNQTINDVTISMLPLNIARPGFNSRYSVVFNNVGTTQLSGTVVINFDNSKVSFVSSNETVTSQTANSVSFNYTNLNPFESRTIQLEFNVLTSTQVGYELDYETTITPIDIDETADDNTFNFTQTVIGSYDPNDITCLEGETIVYPDIDKYIHYIIRFQNTGNYMATFIHIHNTLDNRLDWNTLQMLDASHDYKVEIRDGNEIDFKFDGIYLPDSTSDEEGSQGYIAYKIKPKSDITIEEIISNQAAIYFDYNAAVDTNIAYTQIDEILGTQQNQNLQFFITPIPAKNQIKINSSVAIKSITIYNNLGQVLSSNTNKNNINISSLNTGIYFCKVEGVNGNIGIRKIIKE